MNPPILLVIDHSHKANPFGDYLSEILKTEGFMAHEKADLTRIDLTFLQRFPLVLLAEARPDASQREMLRGYVAGGGKLVAMRPDPALADLFGLRLVGERSEKLLQYLGVNASSEIGHGIHPESLQYHGVADEYEVDGASAIAWLYEDDTTPTSYPAVALNRYGHGQTVAFSYDLARSVALMRQGNPAWAWNGAGCEDGDGFEGIRPVDAFLRQSGESWVDPAKIPIPQADEQQRLLGNCLMALAEDAVPLPRLWYLPEGKRAVLVMTGDGDDVGFEEFDTVMRTVEEYGGHFSAYLLGLEGDPSPDQVADWISRGHEVACHVYVAGEQACPTRRGVESACNSFTARFRYLFGCPPGPSIRHHWLTWYGWTEAAEIAQEHGVRVDFNYYHGRQWRRPDGSWLQGYFTGSALPQRLVTEEGKPLEVFQQLTTWADETQLYRQELGIEGATQVVRDMLDLAESHFPTVFIGNFHPGGFKRRNTEPWARNMMQEAVDRNLPIWSGEELYNFIAARDEARFSDQAWDGSRLCFTLESKPAPQPLALMLPMHFGSGRLSEISIGGVPAGFTTRSFAGRDYAFVPVPSGCHPFVASYAANP